MELTKDRIKVRRPSRRILGQDSPSRARMHWGMCVCFHLLTMAKRLVVRAEILPTRQLLGNAVIIADPFCYYFLPSISFRLVFPTYREAHSIFRKLREPDAGFDEVRHVFLSHTFRLRC